VRARARVRSHSNLFTYFFSSTSVMSFTDKIFYTFILLNVIIYDNIFNTLLSVMSFIDKIFFTRLSLSFLNVMSFMTVFLTRF